MTQHKTHRLLIGIVVVLVIGILAISLWIRNEINNTGKVIVVLDP